MTNLHPSTPAGSADTASEARLSRGHLVTKALELDQPEDVSDWLRNHAADAQYRPFNMLYGLPGRLYTAHAPDGHLEIETLHRGINVIPSAGAPNAPTVPKVARARELMGNCLAEFPAGASSEALAESIAKRVLADTQTTHASLAARTSVPFEALLAINVQSREYGTRSSAIMLWPRGCAAPEYWSIDGNPKSHVLRPLHGLFAS